MPFPKSSYEINWQYISYTLLGYGIIIRIYHFLVNRSLWLDEIYLSSSLLKMSLPELASSPLDYQQQAPVGLLIVIKICVMTFGNNEMTLRLIPLLCGIASLFAFYRIAKYYLSPVGVFISTAMITTAPFLVFHSVEIKQYSSEMLMSSVAILLYIKYNENRDWKSLLVWGLSGSLILWFSSSVIFLLAGIACGLSIYHMLKKNWQTVLLLFVPFALWMVSFLIHYFLFIYTSHKSEWLNLWFHGHNSFMPISSVVSTSHWIAFQFYRFLEYPLGLLWVWDNQTFSNFIIRNFMRMPLLPMVCFALGIVVWYGMEKKSFIILVFPILLTLIASGLELYPVYERLTVFIAPVIILFISMGAQRLMAFKWIRPFSLVVVLLLLAAPVLSSIQQLKSPQSLGGYKNADYREVFDFVEINHVSSEGVYVYWNLVAQYKVYKELSGLTYNGIEGKNLRSQATNEMTYLKLLDSELIRLKGKKRAWLLFDNTLNFDIGDMSSETWYQTGQYGTQPGQRILNMFKSRGKIIKSHTSKNASAYLIDFEINSAGMRK